jgi:hypothetical protein
MAFDDALAERLRDRLRDAVGVNEKKMLGGLALLTDGNMLFFLTLDLVRFVDVLSREAGYGGDWLLGVHVDRLLGRLSRNLANSISLNLAPYDDEVYRQTGRVSARRLPPDAPAVVDRLLRPLFRNLGTEPVLDRLVADS